MSYEVEMKFPVSDMVSLEARLTGMGAAISAPISETDTYFAHPARDFAQTDEGLALRRQDTSHFITYKGPKLDAATKTRREIEIPLSVERTGVSGLAEPAGSLGLSGGGRGPQTPPQGQGALPGPIDRGLAR